MSGDRGNDESAKERLDSTDGRNGSSIAEVPVKGGLYEVDMRKRICKHSYWEGPHWRIRRALWFVQKKDAWLPVREDVGEALETAYQR